MHLYNSQSESFAAVASHSDNPVALGAHRTASNLTSSPQMCILCQEEQDLSRTSRSLVLCAYIQRFV